MKTLQLSRLLLGSLLAALTGWLGACQTRTAAPPPPPASSGSPQQKEHDAGTMPTLQVDGLGARITYTYDADGKCSDVQRSDDQPAPRSARNPDAP